MLRYWVAWVFLIVSFWSPRGHASAPWPQEVDAHIYAHYGYAPQEKWAHFETLSLNDLPLHTRVGWMWALKMKSPEDARTLLEVYHPLDKGKRVPLFCFQDTPLENEAMERTYGSLMKLMFCTSYDTCLGKKGLHFDILDKMKGPFPTLCHPDLLGGGDLVWYPFLGCTRTQDALFCLLNALHLKESTFLTPGLAGILLSHVKAPEDARQFVSYFEGKAPVWRSFQTSSLDLSFEARLYNEQQWERHRFCQMVVALHGLCPRALDYGAYKELMHQTKWHVDMTGFMTTLSYLKMNYPHLLTPHKMTRLIKHPKSDVPKAFSVLKGSMGVLTDTQIEALLGSETFIHDPVQSAQDLDYIMGALPQLSFEDAWGIYTQKAKWVTGEIQDFMKKWCFLCTHLVGVEDEGKALSDLAPLLLKGPISGSFFKIRRSQDENLMDNALYVLRPKEHVTYLNLEKLLTILHGRREDRVKGAVDFLRSMGVESLMGKGVCLRTFVRQPTQVYTSGVLQSLERDYFSRRMDVYEKCMAFEKILRHKSLSMLLQNPKNALPFFSQLQRVMPEYDMEKMKLLSELTPQELEETVDATLAWWAFYAPLGSGDDMLSMGAIKSLPQGKRLEHIQSVNKVFGDNVLDRDPHFALSFVSHAAPVRNAYQTWEDVQHAAGRMAQLYQDPMPYEDVMLLSYLFKGERHAFVNNMIFLSKCLSEDVKDALLGTFSQVINDADLSATSMERYAACVAGLIPFQESLQRGMDFVRALKIVKRIEPKDRALFFRAIEPLKEKNNLIRLMEGLSVLPPRSWEILVTKILADNSTAPHVFLKEASLLWSRIQDRSGFIGESHTPLAKEDHERALIAHLQDIK